MTQDALHSFWLDLRLVHKPARKRVPQIVEAEALARFNRLAKIAAISLDRGEAPKAVAGSQFPLFKMLTDLLESDLGPSGISIDMAKRAVVGLRAACASGYC